MTSTPWRKALALGVALAASSYVLAGCSKGDDSADYGGADPGAVSRATDSADAGMSAPAAAASGVATDTSSTIVSTARTSPSIPPSPSAGDAGAGAPPPSPSPSVSNPDSGSTGRATGPRS